MSIIYFVLISFLSAFFFYQKSLVISIIMVAISTIIFHYGKKGNSNKGMIRFQIIPAAFWVISTYKFNHKLTLTFVFLLIVTFIFWLWTFCLISRFLLNNSFSSELESENRNFLIGIFLLLLVSWSIYLVAFNPGILTNDSYNQWRQANGYLPLSEWHPLIHTYLIKLASSFYFSPISFLFIQLFSAVLLIIFLMKKFLDHGTSKWLIITIVLIYAIVPINGFYVSTLWKDIPYSILLLTFFFYFKELVDSNGSLLKGKRNFFLFLIFSFLTMEFRKNGMIVVVLCLILSLIFIKNKKGILVLILFLFLMTGSFSFLNKRIVKAQESPMVEALSIPIQQVAYVYAHNGKTTKTDDAYFYSILPEKQWKQNYRSMTVDPIKFSPQFEGEVINKNVSFFLKRWFSLLQRNFISFVKAYLLQTASIWRYYTPNNYKVYLDSPYRIEEKNGIYPFLEATVENNESLKNDYIQYKKTSRKAGQDYTSYSEYLNNRKKGDKVILDDGKGENKLRSTLRNIFFVLDREQKYFLRGALSILILLVSVGICCYNIGILKGLLIFSPFLVNLVTLLISVPATDFRYIFSLYFSIPFMLLSALSYQSSNRTLDKNTKNSI